MKRINAELTDEQIVSLIVNDPIKRNQEIAEFLSLIEKIEGGYSIFLNASWGDGKTVFLKQVAMVLKALNPKLEPDENLSQTIANESSFVGMDFDGLYMPVYYNSWRNDSLDDPLPTLIATIATEYDLHELEKDGAAIEEAVIGIFDAILKPANCNVLADFKSAISGKDYLKAYKSRKALRDKVGSLIDAARAERAEKLVLFIDELDRCSPPFALQLLEELKFLFENDQVILVFATDMQQLASSISGAYGDQFDGMRYLGRFYDRVIPLTKPSSSEYLASLEIREDSQYLNSVITSLANVSDLTLRETNCFIESLDKVRELFENVPRDTSMASICFCAGIIPVLWLLRQRGDEGYRQVVRFADPKPIVDFLEISPEFKELCERSASTIASDNLQAREFYTNAETLVVDICLVAFCNDPLNEKRRDAEQHLRHHANQIPNLSKKVMSLG